MIGIGLGIGLGASSLPRTTEWLLAALTNYLGTAPVALFTGDGIASSGGVVTGWAATSTYSLLPSAEFVETTIGRSKAVLASSGTLRYFYESGSAIPSYKTAIFVTEPPDTTPSGNACVIAGYPISTGAQAVALLASSKTWFTDGGWTHYRNGVALETLVSGSGPAVFEATSSTAQSRLRLGAWSAGVNWPKPISTVLFLANQLTSEQRATVTSYVRRHVGI